MYIVKYNNLQSTWGFFIANEFSSIITISLFINMSTYSRKILIPFPN